MSYDVQLTMTTEHDCPNCGGHHEQLDYDGNLTYNVGAMIRRAGIHPVVINGMPVEVAKPVVKEAFMLLNGMPEYFRQFEPDNGWGTVETTRKFLYELLIALGEAPQGAVVRWS